MEMLQTTLPVIVLIALGYLFMRKNWIHPEAVDGMKSFVVNVTLPAVLFRAFYTATYDRNILICSVAMFVACALGLAAGFLITRLIKRLHQPLLPFLTTGFEAGMLGYALYSMLFGEANLPNFAMLDIGHTVFVFTVYTGLLNARSGRTGKETVRAVLRTPILIAMVLGVLTGATGLGARLAASAAGDVAESLLSFVAAPTSCVILFVVGYQMRLNRASLRSAAAAVGIRLCVTAVLCAGCVLALQSLLQAPRELLYAVVLMFLLPAPFVLPIYASDPVEQETAATTLSLNTLVTIVLFAVLSLIV